MNVLTQHYNNTQRKRRITTQLARKLLEVEQLEKDLMDVNYDNDAIEERLQIQLRKNVISLTEREKRFVDLRMKGMKLQEIATEMGITYTTARWISSQLPKIF